MPFTNDVSAPLCLVDFHTEQAMYTTQSTLSPTDDLISVTTSKNLASPAGTWSMELVQKKGNDGKTWYDRINPQDLVVIKMGRPPEALDTVMVGLVDQVRRVKRVGANGELVKRVKISGRDFGKILIKAIIKWFPQFAPGEFELGDMGNPASELMQLTEFFTKYAVQKGSPAKMMETTIRHILFNIMSYEIKFWQNGKKTTATLKEIFRFRLGKTNTLQYFQTSMSQFEGSLWNFFDSIQNKPFTEMFVDTRADFMEVLPQGKVEADSYAVDSAFSADFGEDTSKVVFYLRPTPFDKDDWENLLTHELKDTEIINLDVGRSDHENYNMFLARPKLNILGDLAYEASVKPRFNLDNIKKHGISYLEKDIPGMFVKNEDITQPLKNGGKLSDTLKSWYENNINYENGTLQLKGKGNIKVGQRALVLSDNMVYYVESVNQNFGVFDRWDTHVSVTRGQLYEKFANESTYNFVEDIETTEELFIDTSSQDITTQEPTYHTVQSDDTLWKIAKTYYGDGALYTKIVKANPQITDANVIYTGQRFLIPDV